MESVQWNFDVKVYEIDSFFYVFVYAQISFLSHIHKTYLMRSLNLPWHLLPRNCCHLWMFLIQLIETLKQVRTNFVLTLPGLMSMFHVVWMMGDILDHVLEDIVARKHWVDFAVTVFLLKNKKILNKTISKDWYEVYFVVIVNNLLENC